MSKTWKERYYDEVKRSVLRYEGLNQNAETVVRKITPEEQEEFEALLARKNSHINYLSRRTNPDGKYSV